MPRLVDYIEAPFPGGECYRDVERRVSAFLNDLRRRHEGASVAVVAHQAPQLAFEVLLAGKTWQQAIEQDWRSRGAWQAGWVYEVA
jgi:broad specificity phosphatase PhoE